MSSKNYLSIYAKSFNWAGFFLPKKTYKNCSYLYDFCRVVDNIADDEGEIEIKKVKFQKFVSDFKQKNFENPVIQNMWNIVNECNSMMNKFAFKPQVKILSLNMDILFSVISSGPHREAHAVITVSSGIVCQVVLMF